MKIEVTYKVNCQLQGFRLRLGIVNAQGETAFVSTDQNVRDPRIEPGVYRSTCTIPANLLNVGRYIVRIGAGIPGVKKMLSFKNYVGFNTSGAGNQGSVFPEIWPGVVCPKLDWVIEKGEETSTYSERD
jgi:lipopolysaccharide transport system ATP-binding protein